MILDVFPKVNVFLKILGQDVLGYHHLVSRFCLVQGGLRDVMEVREGSGFALRGNFDCEIQQNTIYKAIISLKMMLSTQNKDARILDFLEIEVEKNIPTKAGLGGGSADAGVLLHALNRAYFDLRPEQLLCVAREVGADVSFFAMGCGSANVSGIGDCVMVYEEEELDFEIFTPEFSCETKRVYQAYDTWQKSQKHGIKKSSVEKSMIKDSKELSGIKSREILESFTRTSLNDLLAPALSEYPGLAEIEAGLGREWFFSGSGSSFFRIRRSDAHHCTQ
ncbi:4-diphosphocytidyl-2-C-methyl-D-erythritol kinase [Helicobacter mustelae]|uniref:4-(cytidine 5'-diphospho)-2-C-methyl-D-erythritol kinase n=1 Tax=Helicobacter mustelae TaxID=217 RepID=UPI000E07FBAC|nr:4-(cytidine 5'-diphospho)-2-C-methyl-D-erythritol kinase [Helicobacter mustelae]STP12836.1 4-diphosphocytidyl-2-C-methyl-D-erythritol kinase [Helicobacter mustelae]